jgi:hypothetical protein
VGHFVDPEVAEDAQDGHLEDHISGGNKRKIAFFILSIVMMYIQ